MPVHAFVFPGQGSQSAGMGRDLAAAFAAAREVFGEVDEVLKQKLSKLMFEGPAEALTLTDQPACGRHIHGDKLHIAVHQVRDKSDVASEPVQLGDHQDGAALAAFAKCRQELRAVGVALAALHFGELAVELAAFANEAGDGLALCIHAEAPGSLFIGRDAVVSDVVRHGASSWLRRPVG